MRGRLWRLASVVPDYARIAWWGLVRPRVASEPPLVVSQGVILSGKAGSDVADCRVLLAVRSNLRGWELPGGTPIGGETAEETLRREVREETGCEVAVDRHVGDYVRSGFRPHTARVFLCRIRSGVPTPSSETPLVRWFGVAELPETIFPWFRRPLADALGGAIGPRRVEERQGLRAVLDGMRIDLKMRFTNDGGPVACSPRTRRGPEA